MSPSLTSRRGAGRLPPMEANALLRARRFEAALGTKARIYYSMKESARGQPQAQHRRRPGLLQQA